MKKKNFQPENEKDIAKKHFEDCLNPLRRPSNHTVNKRQFTCKKPSILITFKPRSHPHLMILLLLLLLLQLSDKVLATFLFPSFSAVVRLNQGRVLRRTQIFE